jgi:alkanesulfonate monooxygenase SsuD/methylene tetrahydromethanopterin reductase-like flavin-dependent oxidoreductase (luciferase family)
MERPLRVGVQLPEVEWEIPFPELLAMARLAEDVGVDSVWLGDHLLYDLPIGPRGPWEAWTSLAAIAAVTNRVGLGPLVASTSFHQPTMLAKQAATVDAISQGRLIVGLGAGWNRREYEAFGFAYDHRVSRFEEAFTIVRTLLRDGRIDFHGDYYDATDCVLSPMPVRPGGPPIMLGSTSPRMASIGLPHVDSWNVWWSIFGNTPEGFADEKRAMDAAARAVGRDPSSVEATCAVLVRAPGGTGRLMGSDDGTEAPAISGDAAEIAQRLREFAEAGAAEVQLVLDPITAASIEWLGAVLADLDR